MATNQPFRGSTEEKKKNGSYKIADPSIIRKRYKRYKLFLKQGDVSFFDSLLCHQSIPNRTKNRARINQIMRFSNLNDELAEDNNWYSSVYERRGILFEQAHRTCLCRKNRDIRLKRTDICIISKKAGKWKN